jgi:hypothetical protein
VRFRNAGAAILHAHATELVIPAQLHLDAAPIRREADGVREQVLEHLRQRFDVAGNRAAPVARGTTMRAGDDARGRLGAKPDALGNRVEKLAEIHGLDPAVFEVVVYRAQLRVRGRSGTLRSTGSGPLRIELAGSTLIRSLDGGDNTGLRCSGSVGMGPAVA